MADTLAPIDFYFDFSSPYGYFASTQIEALAHDLKRSVHWHPVLLGPMFKAMGSAPLVQIPLKGEYSRHDMHRTARLHQIPFQLPSPFPVATVAAARIMLHLQQSDPQLAVRYAHRVFQAYYTQGMNISDANCALQLASDLGEDPTPIADAIATDAIKTLLRQSNEAALARGVFGSPFIIFDDEPFWGFDHFDIIRRWAATNTATSASAGGAA